MHSNADIEVTYLESGKFATFQGKRYCRDEHTGYYLNSHESKRLHRAVWEAYNGAIPDGFEIHHIDHDKGNNAISNLAMVSAEEHRKIHAEELTEEQQQFKRDNVLINAMPKAVEWHHSAAGRLWHISQYERVKEKLHKKIMSKCAVCGKAFEAFENTHAKFCSNNCKSAARRKSGVDSETRTCAFCGGEFIANKYARTRCCSRRCANLLRKSSIG